MEFLSILSRVIFVELHPSRTRNYYLYLGCLIFLQKCYRLLFQNNRDLTVQSGKNRDDEKNNVDIYTEFFFFTIALWAARVHELEIILECRNNFFFLRLHGLRKNAKQIFYEFWIVPGATIKKKKKNFLFLTLFSQLKVNITYSPFYPK